MKPEPRWLVEARKHFGVTEIPGVTHHPLILKMWQVIGLLGIKDDETPWCAAFVGYCLERSGVESTRTGWARDYLKWGIPLGEPCVGCIAVLARKGGGGHVFFVTEQDEHGNPIGIGGNQGNAVNIKTFDRSRVLGYRWPATEPLGAYWGPLPIRLPGTIPTSTNEA